MKLDMKKYVGSSVSNLDIANMLQSLTEEDIVVEKNNDYVKPQFTPLTQEEIDDIHRRGFITQEEAVREWKDMGLCVPGNAGVNSRCSKFNNNCDDCLVDYSLSRKEHVSLMKMSSVISTSEINSLIKALKPDEETGYEKVKK